jgi:YVTN family beta-propeller protein
MPELQHTQRKGALTRNSPGVRIVIVVATIAVAAVGAAVVFMRGGSEDEPTAEKVVATLRVDGEPNGIAVGDDALWIALNSGFPTLEGKLQRVNLVSGAVEKSVPLKGVLTFTQPGDGSVWVEMGSDWRDLKPGRLTEVDWRTGKVLRSIRFDKPPFGFVFQGDFLWVVVGRDPATLVRIDVATGTQVGDPITISARRVIGFAGGEGALWAAAAEEGKLVRIDPRTGKLDEIDVGDFPVGLVAAGGSVWVANRDGGTVSRVDATTLEVVDTIDVGTFPTHIDAAGGSVWVSNQPDGTVSQIDAKTGELVASIKIAPPSDDEMPAAHVVAVGGESVWVSSITERSVSRIDTSR